MSVGRGARRLARRVLPRAVVDTLRSPPGFDNAYPWLTHAFARVVRDRRCALRPQYAWGALQAAALARVLGVPRISLLEFGVAGGYGLLALECAAMAAQRMTGVGIDVVGFDSGAGLPPPQDYRDQPNMWFEGQLPMERAKLEGALSVASLRVGPVAQTLPAFLAAGPAPVAFAAFDLDLYSSTRDALEVFAADLGLLMPRVLAYFDDIFGYTYNEFCGERLAIREFNRRGPHRKVCPVHGLRYFLPRSTFHDLWPDGMHWAHLFRHPRYGTLDSHRKPMFMDIHGTYVEAHPDRRRQDRRRPAASVRPGRGERRTWTRRSAR
jgi:hypothetical protein